jgi:hypothetical protein
VNGCCEHGSKVNYLIAEAMAKKKKLYLAKMRSDQSLIKFWQKI